MISNTTCASGASRMSINAWPSISMLRTTRARPMASANVTNRSNDGPEAAHSSGAERGEEDLAEVVDELGRQLRRPPPTGHEGAESDEDLTHLTVGRTSGRPRWRSFPGPPSPR